MNYAENRELAKLKKENAKLKEEIKELKEKLSKKGKPNVTNRRNKT